MSKPEPAVIEQQVGVGIDARGYVTRHGRVIAEVAYDPSWDDEAHWVATAVVRNVDGEPWLMGIGETMQEAADLLLALWIDHEGDRFLEEMA